MKFLISIILSFVFHKINGQNLVPNPSFEDENICERNQPCSPSAWFYVTKNIVAGYFTNQTPAATGKRWLSIVTGNRENTGGRQYWQTMLLLPVIQGKVYRASLSIHGWKTEPNAKDVGMYFPPKMQFYTADTLIQPKFYVDFSDAKVTKLKNSWFKLEKEFAPPETSQFLMIGNFSSENSQEIAKSRISSSIYIGPLVDDITIEPAVKENCENCSHVKDSLYLIKNRHSDTSRYLQLEEFPETTSPYFSTDTLSLNEIYFTSSSYSIKNPNILDKHRVWFAKPNIIKIKISGYTDDTGTTDGNRILSLRRAQEVAKLISQKFNISPNIIETEGRGVSSKNSNKGENRKVEIYIISSENSK